MISLPLWGRAGWGLAGCLALPAIVRRKPAVSLHGGDRPATAVGDRCGVLWEQPGQLRYLDASLIDPVHHLRPDAGRSQASAARYDTGGRFRDEELL